MLLVVLECLKDCAFHIDTVYNIYNLLDPSRGCTLQAELIVTTSSGSDSSAMGECVGWKIPSFIMVSCAMFTKAGAAHKNYFIIFHVFSFIRSLFDAIFSQDVAEEGR